MWEIQVSGCQLLAAPVVMAQMTPSQVKPDWTWGLAVTYSGSSYVIKPARHSGTYAASTARANPTEINHVRRLECISRARIQ